jgi:hypothetical protein
MKKILLSIVSVVALGSTSFAQIDTLSEFFTGTPTVYQVDAVSPIDSGYIFGNNIYGDAGKLMKFDAVTGLTSTSGFVKGVLVCVPVIYDATGTASINVKMWANSTSTTLGAELASVNVPLSQIDTTIATGYAFAGGSPRLYNVAVNFTTPVAIPADGFMAGITLPANSEGVAVVMNNTVGDFAAATTNAYEIWSDNSLSLTAVSTSWGASLTSAMAIYPIVNYTASIDEPSMLTTTVYPNPTNDVVNFSLNGVEIANVSIFSLDGKLVSSNTVNAATTTVDVTALNAGMYIYKMTSKNGNVVKDTFVKK